MNKTEINIFFIVAAFLLGAVITFFIFTLTKKDCEICEKCDEFKIGEEVKLPLEEENVFDLLYDYASKRYEKKEYEKLKVCYIDQVYHKEITVLLYSYYRHFWSLDDSRIKN